MTQAPGTVSKILWHFTGGPRWNTSKNRQEKRRKPEGEAYKALLSILRTKELKLGDYREVVRVRLPKLGPRNEKTGRFRIVKYEIANLQSSPVCCLSDIPIAHLSYQAKRYGRIAIGFHRDAVVRHGFNPVFYTLSHTRVLRSIYECLEELVDVDSSADSIDWSASEIESETATVECEHDHPVEVDIGSEVSSEVSNIQSSAGDIAVTVLSAQENLKKFLAFVKSFGANEFSTIYCEREWRSTQPFSFSEHDVAMIVLPKRNTGRSYFDDFTSRKARTLALRRSIPVVPWEDLIEH